MSLGSYGLILTFMPFAGGFSSEAPGGNHHSPGERILTRHRQACRNWGSNPQPFCCDAVANHNCYIFPSY